MIEYAEYIRGEEKYRSRIAYNTVIKKLDPEGFYPVIAMRDDEDEFPLTDVLRLPKETKKIYPLPGVDPVERQLYIDEFVGYEVNIVKEVAE